jgi:high-affinity Fe2+/Pb2+ permease
MFLMIFSFSVTSIAPEIKSRVMPTMFEECKGCKKPNK